MEGADVRRAVAEHADGALVGAPDLRRQCCPGRDGDAGTDDRRGRHQPDCALRQVHRAAHPADRSDRAPGDLAEHGIGGHTECEGVTVPAIGAADVIGRASSDGEADSDGFLTLARVGRAVDQPLGEQRRGAILEPADLEHAVPAGDGIDQRGASLERCHRGAHDAYPSRSHHGRGRRPVSINCVMPSRTSCGDGRYRCSRWAG